MKLNEYVANLNKLLKDNPDIGELEIVTSIDDESNGYNEVSYFPSIGYYDKAEDRFTTGGRINSVCVN